jgi:tetratricopeptide (TPR) repeat protein
MPYWDYYALNLNRIYKKNMKFYYYLVFCILLASCQKHYTRNSTILRAEVLLNSKPDSAQKLLLSISHPEKLSNADYAAWCLLYTNSQYKLNQDIKSDSIIGVSVNYYENSSLAKQCGTAYYLSGCIAQLKHDNKEAMQFYKKAEDILQATNDNRTKGLVEFNIGYLCMQDELYNQALKYYRKSVRFYSQTNNKADLACVYIRVSDMYNQLDYPFDSVMHYSNLALKLAKEGGDIPTYHQILSRQGGFCYSRNRDYAHAKKCILKAFHYFPDQQSYYAAYLAYIYSKLHKLDSAKYYLKIALTDTTNANEKLLKFVAAAHVYRSEGNSNLAFDFFERAYNNREATFLKSIQSQLYQTDKQFDLSQKDKENANLKIANQYKVILISFLATAILVSLFVALLLYSEFRRKRAEHKVERQRMEYENSQKQELLLTKLQNKIENTLRFNQLKTGLLQQEKHDAFLEEITRQAIISEKEWQSYIDEINQLFNGKITSLSEEYQELTQSDLIVIALICLQNDIADCCSLLNMSQNTMYMRRKRIKKRLDIDVNIDLDSWLRERVAQIPTATLV